MTVTSPRPMHIRDQIERLIARGVHDLAGTPVERFRRHGDAIAHLDGGTVVPHPALVPASRLAASLERDGKPGFVVHDLSDLDEFVSLPDIDLPDAALYVVTGIDRGDDLANWSPHEALAEITARDRTPLTVGEGIGWLLQEPDKLERNKCFMCIASRKPKQRGGLDARTPAIWISGGTGHDGPERRGAPKIGWCWAGNRHTWLGFASATARLGAERDPVHGT